jgi:hypothetical protein
MIISTLIKNFRKNETWLSLCMIGLISLLAYAPLIPWLGFYREDWYILWIGSTQGPKGFIPLFQIDRPFMGYLYALLYPILGNSALPWQLYALFMRLVGIYALFWLLHMIWPNSKFTTTLATILFAIYPGFVQQPQANSFQVHITGVTLAISSIALMVYSFKANKVIVSILTKMVAVLSTLLYPFLMEYYIGLEALRVILLWIVLQKKNPLPIKQNLSRFFKHWAPYLVVTTSFLFWRLFIFSSLRPTTDINRLVTAYTTDYRHMALRFVIELCKNILETGILAWAAPLNNYLNAGTYLENIIAIIIALASGALFFTYLYLQRSNTSDRQDTPEERQVYKSFIVVGALGMIAALIPSLAANQVVRFIGREDRFTLPASVGAALLVTGLISMLVVPQARRWVYGILIGFAIITHFNHAIQMRNFWEVQRQVWWQLSWRAPEIKRNTLLMVNLPDGFDLSESTEIWPTANLIYYPESAQPMILGEILSDDSSYQVQWETQKTKTYRGIWLNRHFENSLILSLPTPESCLNVIDGYKYELSAREEPLVRIAAPFSHINRIITNQPFTIPPTSIFGREPDHSWCYYYQKAMYHRQIGEWEEIALLGNEAIQHHYAPTNLSEWMPFFEAYINTGRDSKAQKLASLIRSEYGPRNSICQNLASAPPVYPGEYQYEKIMTYLCPPKYH